MDIQVLREADSGSLLGYYARGHHDPEDFIRELGRQLEVESGHEGTVIGPQDVFQKWYRNVPAPWLDDPAPILMYDASPGTQGAYPVTVLDLDSAWRRHATPTHS